MSTRNYLESLPNLSSAAMPTEEADYMIVSAVISDLVDVVAAEIPASQGHDRCSTSNSKNLAEAFIAADLAKLNDPHKKLNRRERRALQRMMIAGEGVHKQDPVSQSTFGDSNAESKCAQSVQDDTVRIRNEKHEVFELKGSERANSFGKRSAVTDGGIQELLSKLPKVQIPVPLPQPSVFKRENLSMTLCDSVSKPFECSKMSGLSNLKLKNNFLKLCRFSMSGSCIATTSADNSARIFELNEERRVSLLSSIPLGDPIYDAQWLCGGTAEELLATSAKYHPIHLWSSNGKRCASYRGMNHLDELTAAYSIAFSNSGTRLYGGHRARVWIWDIERPGRQHTTIETWEKGTGGQKSIVSCIAMNKSFDGIYAVATYGGSVGFYSDRSNSLECLFSTESTAITDMHYSYDGLRLYVAPRKSGEILCYDMRKPGDIMFRMLRPFTTNQKTCFDVERSGYYLFSGTSNGDFVVFDLRHEETVKLPIFTRKIAECAVSCVSVHECEPPLVALCTGERVFPKPEISSSHSSESESDQERMYSNRRHSRDFNNSLQLWAFDNET
ncbi:hypothetical protein V3C99_012021 [Haemonchus contortus]